MRNPRTHELSVTLDQSSHVDTFEVAASKSEAA